MARFRKKPVEVEAVRYLPEDGLACQDLIAFLEGCEGWHMASGPELAIVIPTLEGDHEARSGDWIIKGVAGEFYPCKHYIFEATYEPVEDGE